MTTFTVYAEYVAAQAAGQRNIRFESQAVRTAPRNGILTQDNGGNASTQSAIHSYTA